MKKNILIFLAFNICQICYSQVKKYFIPSDKYFSQEFVYESSWTNENGLIEKENRVNYSLDLTGDYKKYIVQEVSINNIPQTFPTKLHEFFSVSENSVAQIYSYVEGLTEELQALGFNVGKLHNTVILKNGNSQWQEDDSDKSSIMYYESEFGAVKTKYGNYHDCIIVNKKRKNTSGQSDLNFIENYSYKDYYAKNIGLVKTELYENGSISNMETGYGGVLVDNFSEYSFYQKEKRENEKKIAEREAEELRLFLIERKSKIYDYKELKRKDFDLFDNTIKQKMNELLNRPEFQNIYYTSDLSCYVDSTGVTKFNNSVQQSNNTAFEKEIVQVLKSNTLPVAQKNNYTVSSSFRYTISAKKHFEKFTFVKTESDLKLQEGNEKIFKESKSFILRELKQNSLPLGTYKVSYATKEVNGKTSETVHYNDYKGFGGPANCIFSMIVPGLGNHFVNEKKKPRWLYTTIGVTGLIGGGFYERNLSQLNYEKYKSAKTQGALDSYYELANSQHQLSIGLFTIGALWWARDIIHVASKGSKNKKATLKTMQKMNLALYPTRINNSYALGLNIKF